MASPVNPVRGLALLSAATVTAISLSVCTAAPESAPEALAPAEEPASPVVGPSVTVSRDQSTWAAAFPPELRDNVLAYAQKPDAALALVLIRGRPNFDIPFGMPVEAMAVCNVPELDLPRRREFPARAIRP